MRRDRGGEEHVRDPGKAQRDRGQRAELGLVLELCGDRRPEAQEERDGRDRDGSPDELKREGHGLFLVATAAGAPAEARKEVDGVVHGDAERQAADHGGGGVQRDSREPEQTEVEGHRQHVGDQRQEAHAPRSEQGGHRREGHQHGEGDAAHLTSGDAVHGPRQENRLAGHPALDGIGEPRESRLQAVQEGVHAGGVLGAVAHQDGGRGVGGIHEAAHLRIGAEEEEL
jgi:hypothetical protein